jgi:2-polyprenyl-6-methoxyphenol hydroxylase-like FAD-dependent oxidoreductase/SAM-dependent methyltransferase
VDCWRPVIPSELEDALTAAAEIQALKEAHHETWASGDYPRVAERVTGVRDRIVERAGVKPGSQVLDIAAGTGNASIPAARAGAHVIATDLKPELLSAGRSRALDAGVEIEWISADAEDLPFEDERFDYMLSSIGVQFAPRHEIVARELVRVCSRGGTIALGNWAADGYLGRFWTVMGPYLPAPSYASPPAGGGRVEHVEELFVGYPVQLSFERGALDLEAESPTAFIDFIADSYGPLLGARNKLSGDGRWEPLRNELIALSNEMNAADDGRLRAPANTSSRSPASSSRQSSQSPYSHAKREGLMPLRANNPDVVVVGAGIAGASIAAVLARGGIEVLLLERQHEYRDRVRGEFMQPWGVLEARAAGLEDVIRSTQAVDGRYSVRFDELTDPSLAAASKRDNAGILPDVAGALCASHPRSCQALADEAVHAGAQVVRGVDGVRVQTGKRPAIAFRNGAGTELRPRLIIGADGRWSTVRRQSNIEPATHMVAGLLVTGASQWPDDLYAIGVEGDLLFYVFPQGSGRARLYTCHANGQSARWAGPTGAQRLVQAFAGLRAVPDGMSLGEIAPAGPCATFGGEHLWCDKPYADGIVLIGDAGGYDDPATGQGLSLAMSDVRQLSDLLLASDDWTEPAFRAYGQRRAERLRRMRRVSKTYAALMTTFTDAGRARRARFYEASREGREDARTALAAMAIGPDRLPAEAFTDELHEALLA